MEIKYVKSRPTSDQFFEITKLFLLSISHYEQSLQRPKVIPILIIVLDVMDKHEIIFSEAKQVLKEFARNLGVDNLRIIYILKTEIESLEPEKFIVE